MKNIILTISFCSLWMISKGQVQTAFTKDSLTILKHLNLKEGVDVGNYSIVFKKVVVDSRCPKNVTCVRAGEAEVMVSIYENNGFIEDKTIRIYAADVKAQQFNLILKSKEISIYGFSLDPYPDIEKETKLEDYKLGIIVQEKTES